MLTAERLRKLLHYDAKTGAWSWRVRTSNRIAVGDVAGSLQNNGYLVIRVDGHLHQSSRLAFVYMTGDWPPKYVDHVDGDRSNDRWSNLRTGTCFDNAHNTRTSRRNKSGVKGVWFIKASQRWRARIMVNRRALHLGCFVTKEDARAAYCAAARKHFGEFARFD